MKKAKNSSFNLKKQLDQLKKSINENLETMITCSTQNNFEAELYRKYGANTKKKQEELRAYLLSVQRTSYYKRKYCSCETKETASKICVDLNEGMDTCIW